MTKKILFIITHLELGGAQKQLLTILKNLNPDKYSLYLFAGNRGYLKKEFINLPYLHLKLIPQLIRTINPLYDIIAFFKLYFFIKKHKFDIIHTHSPKASLLGRWAGYLGGVKNIIYTVHGWPFHRFMNPFAYHLFLLLEKLTAKITGKIIVVSSSDLKTGIKKKIAPTSKFTLIHYGIDIALFNDIYKKRSVTPPKGYLVTTVSSLKPQKGLNYFLDMAKEVSTHLPQAKFYIVGDGPLRKSIREKIKRLKLERNVFLKGWVKDISSVYLNTSLFVLTSLWEGLPVSLIEAVVSGIPVLVTNTGGVLDIVKEGKQGKIIEFTELSKAGAYCENMLQNYHLWNKITREARKDISLGYWACQRMIKETEEVYKELCCGVID